MSAPLGLPFALSDGERMHPLWKRLEAHFVEKLADLRGKNDNPTLDQFSTARLRGHIECLRGVIALGAEPPRE